MISMHTHSLFRLTPSAKVGIPHCGFNPAWLTCECISSLHVQPPQIVEVNEWSRRSSIAVIVAGVFPRVRKMHTSSASLKSVLSERISVWRSVFPRKLAAPGLSRTWKRSSSTCLCIPCTRPSLPPPYYWYEAADLVDRTVVNWSISATPVARSTFFPVKNETW